MQRHDDYTFFVDDTVYKQYEYNEEKEDLKYDEHGEPIEVPDDTPMTYGEFREAIESLIEQIKDDFRSIVEGRVG